MDALAQFGRHMGRSSRSWTTSSTSGRTRESADPGTDLREGVFTFRCCMMRQEDEVGARLRECRPAR